MTEIVEEYEEFEEEEEIEEEVSGHLLSTYYLLSAFILKCKFFFIFLTVHH